MNIWIKALLTTFLVIVVLKVSIFAATGLWIVGFGSQSGSMEPNIKSGDLIFVQSPQRTNITTYEEGKSFNYRSLNEYGDIIAFYPSGNSKLTPLLHRAMYFVNKGEPMWPGGLLAPHAGYITKGDNNRTNQNYDQRGSVSHNQPIKKEWIIGIAQGRAPYLGYFSTQVGTVIFWVFIYFIILVVLYQLRNH